MTTKIVSLLISEINTASPKYCVAADQLIIRTLPQPVGNWKKIEVTLDGDSIAMVKTSGSSEDEQVYVEVNRTAPLFGFLVTIGDNERWKLIDATSRPPIYALLKAMQGGVEEPETDGPFVMNTMLVPPALKAQASKPNLRLVDA